jgi:asparagine synthase (glutamine-hydrolysing)
MTKAIAHRGPDDGGAWSDARAGIALGHRRLSVLELSPLGNQPMVSHDERMVISFNGEIYNFAQLRDELVSRGRQFRGGSDTEVLLEAFCEWGVPETLKKASGMFAIALWDRRERVLTLARDRLGEKPMYYGFSGELFLFGSELRALQRHPAWKGELDHDALALVMRYSCIPAPYSAFRNILKLPPGTWIELKHGETGLPQPRPYWSLHQVAEAGARDPIRASEEETVLELERKLREVVKQQMVADVPLGVFLSGGVDSTLITAMMQSLGPGRARTFTIGFREPEYNEAEHARRVAERLGTDHTEIVLTEREVAAEVTGLPAVYDEPFADSSQLATLAVSRLARTKVTVSLSGDGGDEVFAGYNRHIWGERLWSRLRHVPRPARGATARLLGEVPSAAWKSEWLKRVLPPVTLASDKIEKVIAVLPSHDPLELYQRLLSHTQTPEQFIPGSSALRIPALEVSPLQALDRPLLQMQFLDSVFYLPNDILVKLDRAAMSIGLETRAPFLDHRVVEFAWRLPVSYRIGLGVGKKMLRQLLKRYLPADLVERPKAGFALPVGQWLKSDGHLRDWSETLLSETALRATGVFDPARIRQLWKEHLIGRHNWQYLLWDALMLQSWLQKHRRPAL